MNSFEIFPECSLPSTVSKNTIKMIGHYSRLRDVMGQSYPNCACTHANHACYSSVHVTFCGSSKQFIKVILRKKLFFKIRQSSYFTTLLTKRKNLTGRKCQAYRTISYNICGNITLF